MHFITYTYVHIYTIYIHKHYSCHATGLRSFFVASSGGILQVLHSLDLDRVDWEWEWGEYDCCVAIKREKLPKRHK